MHNSFERRWPWIRAALQYLIGKAYIMASDLTQLTQEVNENTTVIGSAITLIEGLAAKIEELKNDPAALQALADQLDAQSNALAAAVQAHTLPPAPTPGPFPPTGPRK